MPRDDIILWIDLETTGSDDDDKIIEVGAILTDRDLNEISYFESVISPKDALEQEESYIRMAKNDIVLNMHTNSGLMYDFLAGQGLPIDEAEDAMLDWLSENGAKDSQHIPLAGSGVGHFDRKYIRRYWPRLDKKLTYWVYDVGVLRRVFELAGLEWISEQKTHRALDDITFHLDEMRYCINKLKGLK